MLQLAKTKHLQTSSASNDHTERCDRQCLRNVAHRQRNNLHSLMSLMMLGLLLTVLQSPFASAQVPNDLPAILSLIYSNIPQIKAGSDSRIGIGYAIGNQADFQIVFEFGPQKFTKPLGNQDKSKESTKRQVDLSQQRAASRNEANSKKTQPAWLDKWSSNMDAMAKKKVSTNDVTPKKSVVQKPELVQLLPPHITPLVMQQLTNVHKVSKTTPKEESVGKGATKPETSLLPVIGEVAEDPTSTSNLKGSTQRLQNRKRTGVAKELTKDN